MLSRFFLAATLFFTACACPSRHDGGRVHPLVGAWRAEDATIFDFRKDGTFVGVDFSGREIWGNWVRLDESRIGFQSLMHDSFYRPQYAVIRTDTGAMDYIVTGGTGFIPARRVSEQEARAGIARALAGKILLPFASVNPTP